MKTLYSKWLYIENKNIIINLSSGMKQGGGGYYGRQYVRALMRDLLHRNRNLPLNNITNTAAVTTEQINTVHCFFFPNTQKSHFTAPFSPPPAPLRGGPTVWQTKADSKNRQWAQAVCLHNDSSSLHHRATHTNHTTHRARAEMCACRHPCHHQTMLLNPTTEGSGQTLRV